jgi:hypothetical protein
MRKTMETLVKIARNMAEIVTQYLLRARYKEV